MNRDVAHPFFRKRHMRGIAAVVLVFFSVYCIEPWNYLVWAQTVHENGELLLATPGAQPQSVSGQLEETLRVTRYVINALERELSEGQDSTFTLEALKGHQRALELADPAIRSEFVATEKFLKEKKLPKKILKRQKEASQQYKKAYDQLLYDIKEIHKLEAKRKALIHVNDHTTREKIQKQLQQKIKTVSEQIQKSAPQERSPAPRIESLPNRTREIKTPKTYQTSWLKPISDFLFPSAYAAEPPPTPEDLAETPEIQLTQEIRDLASELDNNAVRIYEFVRYISRFEAYRGSVKGASQTLEEKAGNDIDLASLLIALYRAAGIGAHYVQGTIEIPIDRAKAWTGIDDPQMVGSLFMSKGIPTTLMYRGTQVEAIRVQHVWVEAYVPFLNGRGVLTGPGDTWVQMDPSFKTHTISQALTLPKTPTFDQGDYLSTFRTESPLDFYKTTLQKFLDTNAPGYGPRALARKMEIEFEFLGILVGQPPYTVLSISNTFSEVPDSLRQTFTLTLEDPLTAEPELTYTVLMPSVIGKRLTLSYTPATAADAQTIAAYGTLYDTPPYLVRLVPQLKLEGHVVAQGPPLGSGEERRMRFIFNDTFFTEQVGNNIIAGEYYAIALNAQVGSGSHAQVLERSQRLAQINATINLADPTTLDDRLGELLYLSALTFHHNLNFGIREMAPLHQVVDVRDVSEIMYFLTVQVNTVFGVPKRITPVGITGDMDRDTHLVIPVDGDLSRIKPFILLEGTQSSYLEHNVTEEIYQTEAMSAVKGIQLAHDQAIPVHTVTKQNVTALLPILQLSSDLETEIANAANAGMEITVPERNLVVQDWRGVGYILLNPANGEGAYRVSGGFGGVVVVSAAYMNDLLRALLSAFAANVVHAGDSQRICYWGRDNNPNTEEDNVCYREIRLEEIVEKDELKICGTNPDCKGKYEERYKVSHQKFAQPLIDTAEHGLGAHLTKNITVSDWQSQDGARYMRAGTAIMATIESLITYFMAKGYELSPIIVSGYRTMTKNLSLSLDKDAKPSKSSHHVDGVAVDIQLSKNRDKPPKCEILNQALILIGGKGEVLGEARADGEPKSTVHIATPGLPRTDQKTQPHQWECK